MQELVQYAANEVQGCISLMDIKLKSFN
jgi:hypothetical protein